MTEFNPHRLSQFHLLEAAKFVARFQEAFGLDVDGMVGEETWGTVNKLFTKAAPCRAMSEREHHMIDAATQHGFEAVNDDATVYVATKPQIVSLMQSYRSTDELSFAEARLTDWIDGEAIKSLNVILNTFAEHGTGDELNQAILTHLGDIARGASLQVIMNKALLIDNLANSVHAMNVAAGWWNDLKTGIDLHGKRNIGELLALKHSEISEAHDATDDIVPLLAELQVLTTFAMVQENDRKERVLAVHSALSRAMEFYRKGNKADDKLPHRPGFRVELIDAIIRALDTLASDRTGQLEHPAGTIFMEKVNYNRTRPDHKPENRLGTEGKTF